MIILSPSHLMPIKSLAYQPLYFPKIAAWQVPKELELQITTPRAQVQDDIIIEAMFERGVLNAWIWFFSFIT